MKNRVHIYPTENGWIVEGFQSWTEHTACPGKQWSFETLGSVLKALPGILDPTEQPKPAAPKWEAKQNETPLPAAQSPAIYQP